MNKGTGFGRLESVRLRLLDFDVLGNRPAYRPAVVRLTDVELVNEVTEPRHAPPRFQAKSKPMLPQVVYVTDL